MKYIIGYSKYGLDLNVGSNPSKDELIRAFIEAMGGPQNAFDHFLRHVSFIEDTIKDAEIIKE